MNLTHGRSPSGRATDASHEAPSGLRHPVGIPNALEGPNYAPIFRRGMGVVIEAIDAFRHAHAKANRQSATVRRFDDALNQLLNQLAQDSRIPWLIRSYHDANDASNSIGFGVKHMVRVLTASGMSAGTAETQSGSGLQPASPTAEGGDAQPNPPSGGSSHA